MGTQAEREILAGGRLGDMPLGAELAQVGRTTVDDVPVGFSLAAVARSHAASGLPPSCYDLASDVMFRTLVTPDAGPLTVAVHQSGRQAGPEAGRVAGREAGGSEAGGSEGATRLAVRWGRTAGSEADKIAVRAQLRHLLALRLDLSDLHRVCLDAPGYEWIGHGGLGCTIRAPTVWEDLVRALAATNSTLRRTRTMLGRLVTELGQAGPAGERAFPSAAAVAQAGADRVRTHAGFGYRAAPLWTMARLVADGRVDPDSWLDPATPDEAVRTAVRALPGFGPFATEEVVAAVGRPRALVVDAWARSRVGEMCGLGRAADDQDLRARYGKFGRWAGTVCRVEVTRRWQKPQAT